MGPCHLWPVNFATVNATPNGAVFYRYTGKNRVKFSLLTRDNIIISPSISHLRRLQELVHMCCHVASDDMIHVCVYES